MTVATMSTEARPRVQVAAKRGIDLVLASALLVILAPLLALVALAVRLTSPGPAIFRQERLGQHQRPFTVLKFRSMRSNADPEVHRRFLHQQANGDCDDVELFKVTDDTRVTAVGRLIRKLSYR